MGKCRLHHKYRFAAILPGCRHHDTDERFDYQFRGLNPDRRQLQCKIRAARLRWFYGNITYSGFANAIKRGYASAATDDGSHAGGQP